MVTCHGELVELRTLLGNSEKRMLSQLQAMQQIVNQKKGGSQAQRAAVQRIDIDR